MGKVYGRTAADFAGRGDRARARRRRASEAGDVDGLLINGNGNRPRWRRRLQFSLGLEDLTLLNVMSAFGSTAGDDAAVRGARDRRRARRTSSRCVYADAPLREGGSMLAVGLQRRGASTRRAWPGCASPTATTARQLRLRAGAAPAHAPVRHDAASSSARSRSRQREWALMNPLAQMRKPMTLDGPPRLALGRRAAAPVRLLPGLQRRRRGDRDDRGARARPAPAAGLPARLRPVPRPATTGARDRDPGIAHGRDAGGRAGVAPGRASTLRRRRRPRAVRLLHVHGPRHARGLRLLREGRGRRLRRGRQARARRLAARRTPAAASSPSYYMWGFTPLSEGVIQARGQAGERQVAKHDHRARRAATAAS